MNLFEMVAPSTFTLIVPGVGDHKSGDALSGVQKVYEKYLSSSGIPVEPRRDANLSEFLPDGFPKDLAIRGLFIRLQGGTHVVATLDWSHTRKRLALDSTLPKGARANFFWRALVTILGLGFALKDWCSLLLPHK